MGVTIRGYSSYEFIPQADSTVPPEDDRIVSLWNYEQFAARLKEHPPVATDPTHDYDKMVFYGWARITDEHSRSIGVPGWEDCKVYGVASDFSYGGYNRMRRMLSAAVFDVVPEMIWSRAEDYEGKPFYEQIHFADNEGVLGTSVCRKLAKDYAENRDRFIQYHGPLITDVWYWTQKYDELAAVFRHATPHGLVVLT